MTTKIALVRGPHLRPNGVLPWEYLHNNSSEYEITAFESNPARFDTTSLEMPVKSLHWLDAKISLFSYENFFTSLLSRLNLPPKYLLGMRNLAKKYDVIHTSENFFLFSLQAAFWSKVYDTEFIFSAGENIPYPLFQRNPITWQIKKFVNGSAEAITVTTMAGKRALIHEGVDSEKITVLPNALKLEKFEDRPKSEVDVEEIDELPSDIKEGFNISFVHGLNEQKGVKYLIKAFNQLEEDLEDANLILVGTNSFNEEYYHSNIENAENIHHIKYIPNKEISKVYNLSDVFVLPSITMPKNEEQFGMVVLEAMACGTPSIVTNVGGLPHVVEEGKTSLVVEERNAGNLSDAVKMLYQEETLRRKLGAFSKDYVEEEYSPARIGSKLKRFYNERL